MQNVAEIHVLSPFGSPSPEGVYGAFDGPMAVDGVPRFLPKGALAAVRPAPGARWREVARVVEGLAARVVNAPVALRTDRLAAAPALRYVSNARALGVGVAITGDAPTVAELRDSLTDPWGWNDLVVAWVRRRGIDLPADAAELMGWLAEHSAEHKTVTDVAASHGPDLRQWRRIFDRARLGGVGDWHQALRVVGLGLRIQREPRTRVAVVADRAGYSGAGALTERFHEVVGARPAFIRAHLGWHWMLANALARRGLMRNGQIRPRDR